MPLDVDLLIAGNDRYAARHVGGRPKEPTRHTVVVTCMDARIDALAILGLEPGEAHVLRNAGGVVTDDVRRSILISQRALGTRHVVLVKHTGCGMHGLDEDAFLEAVQADSGSVPPFPLNGFDDPYEEVRAGVAQLRATPWLPHRAEVVGFVWDVETGRLELVEGPLTQG